MKLRHMLRVVLLMFLSSSKLSYLRYSNTVVYASEYRISSKLYHNAICLISSNTLRPDKCKLLKSVSESLRKGCIYCFFLRNLEAIVQKVTVNVLYRLKFHALCSSQLLGCRCPSVNLL